MSTQVVTVLMSLARKTQGLTYREPWLNLEMTERPSEK